MSLPSCTWRPGDAEALRIALALPVSPAALAALRREMAGLQQHYPTAAAQARCGRVRHRATARGERR